VYIKEYPNLNLSYEIFEYIILHFDLYLSLKFSNSSFPIACMLMYKIVSSK
jgi:hypothetical protein